jgi:predicted nucleic acid-binding protein
MTSDSTNSVLVDTNVLIYAVDPADAAKQVQAIAVLAALVQRRRVIISTQVVGEFFYGLTRRIAEPIAPAVAEVQVRSVVAYLQVLPLTSQTAAEAISCSVRNRMAYWDALIWATAKLNGISVIVTEDVQSSGIVDGVRYVNPFAPGLDPASV